MLASGLGVPVRESTREEAGAAGTAMMAAVAIGAEPDMASAVRTWVTPCLGGTVQPDPVLQTRYDELFPIYVKDAEDDARDLGRPHPRPQQGEFMSKKQIAVIGDHFMKASAFTEALKRVPDLDAEVRVLELPWPDQPMKHGYVDGGLKGLKEYLGDPD